MPAVWLTGALYGTVDLALDRDPMALLLLGMLVVGFVFFRQFWFRLKNISASQDGLLVDSKGEQTLVPYSSIADVRQHDWLGFTEVVLKEPSSLRRVILYVPFVYKFLPYTGEHPANSFLREKAGLAHVAA
jgi:hypothetical protein